MLYMQSNQSTLRNLTHSHSLLIPTHIHARSLSALSQTHTLLTPTHTTHPHPHPHKLPTNQICGHDMQFCVARFQHIMQYIQVAIHNQLELS